MSATRNGPIGICAFSVIDSSICLDVDARSRPGSARSRVAVETRMRLTTKPGHSCAADRHLPDRLGEVGGRLDRLGRGVLALDDLDQPHVGGGPEEVEADDLVGPVGGVADLGDREPRRVGGEDRVARASTASSSANTACLISIFSGTASIDEVDVAERRRRRWCR